MATTITATRVPVKEINLKELYRVIKKRIWIIVLSTLLFTIIGGLLNSMPETPYYQASSRIIIPAESAESLGTFKVFIREPIVIERVLEELKLDRSIGALRSQVSVSNVDGSIITLVSATDPNPKLAVAIANATVDAFKAEVNAAFGLSGIKVLTEAEESQNPYPINPKSNRMLYVGVLAGFAIGIALAFLRDSLDDSLRSKRQVEQLLGLQVLGQVPKIKRKDLVKTFKHKSNQTVRGETIGS
ncbi:YveK family protein [Paenibacillus harenae]|uniref:Capsular polysaccharide biosynthesis protein n=1 Tax=Paenibacillus harenae TaxID=306543 RepID=A0ABT9U5C7_PAEHA|nr:Wzz/FepE/Etk N-terminal domain-containing protein [Paenibacillus harenae]MDQ0114844.1 capsular polysaccharide biosynthesis protein [Paenibacillus harenae]